MLSDPVLLQRENMVKTTTTKLRQVQRLSRRQASPPATCPSSYPPPYPPSWSSPPPPGELGWRRQNPPQQVQDSEPRLSCHSSSHLASDARAWKISSKVQLTNFNLQQKFVQEAAPYLFVIISPADHQGGGRLGVELTPLLPEHLAGC